MRKRQLFAALLLAIFIFQWIGGRSFAKLSSLVLIERQMDERETAIAEALKEKIGIDAHVKVQNEQQLKKLQRLGCAAPLLLFHVIGDQHHHYIVEQHPVHYEQVSYTAEGPTGQQSDQNVVLERLFSDFVFDADGFTAHLPFAVEVQQLFALAELHGKGASAPGTPPPQYVPPSSKRCKLIIGLRHSC